MKKNLVVTSFLLLSTFLSVVFYSCQKNSPSTNLATSSNTSSPTSQLAGAPCNPNPQNSYDMVGMLHNQALDDMMNSPNFMNQTHQERHSLAMAAAAAYGNSTTTPATYQAIYDFYDNATAPLTDMANQAFADGDISAYTKSKIESLSQILLQSEDEIAFDMALQNFETQYINEGPMAGNDHEQSLILGACAVARYSRCYWSNVVDDENNPWYPTVITLGDDPMQQNKSKLSKWWNKMTKKEKTNVVAADVSGFLIGGWVGFKAGTMLGLNPGTGLIVGAVTGIVTGAVVSAKVAK